MAAPWASHPLKRSLDIAGALLLLILLSPLLGLLACIGMVVQGFPLFFQQTRPGREAALFTLYKFRSMRTGNGEDTARTTGYGRFLRRFGLDELPELWNIVRGDMSFVGPRPLLPDYLPRYSPEQARRHEVRPGLTGWAQVHGRNAVDWERKFELDVWYVDHASPLLDAKILVFTVWGLICRNQGDHIPEPFQGTSEKE